MATRAEHRIQRRRDHFTYLNTRAPTLDVNDLILVFRRGERHVFVHVNHCHHRAWSVARIYAGAMECPASMKTHISQFEPTFFHTEGLQCLFQRKFALATDLKIAANLKAMTLLA